MLRGPHLLELGIALDVGARRPLPAAAEAGEAALEVEEERVALLLAVIADVDPGGALLLDHAMDGRAPGALDRSGIDRLSGRTLGIEPRELRRSRQAAGVSGEDAVHTALHDTISIRHARRQPQRELRPEDDQPQHHEHDQVKRDGADHHLAQFAVPDALDHEQVDADRRGDLAELDEDHQHDAEQDRVDVVALEYGEKQRDRDHDHAEALDQAAQDGEQDQQRDVELELGEMQSDDELGDLFADAAEAQRHREDVGGEDQKQDVAAEVDGVVHRLERALEVELAERHSEQNREHAADHRRLGGGHHAEIEPAEGGGDQHEERHDVGDGAQELAQRARAGLVGGDRRRELGVHADVEHEQRGHDQPGDHAGDEQLGHRGLGEG